MPASEIDDIFAGKVVSTQNTNKRKKDSVTASDGLDPLTSSDVRAKKKKKKKKTGDAADVDTLDPNISTSTKASKLQEGGNEKTATKQSVPVPTTVVDPSARTERRVAVSNSQVKVKKSGKNRVSDAGDDNDESRFRDSRGTGPRESSLV